MVLIWNVNTFHVVNNKCELPPVGENVALITGGKDIFFKDSVLLLSCLPGHRMPSEEENAIACTCDDGNAFCKWIPNPTGLQCLSMLCCIKMFVLVDSKLF